MYIYIYIYLFILYIYIHIYISNFYLYYIYSFFLFFFDLFIPKCVAKGSRFTIGGLGVDPCSRDLRNRLQPFATVLNRPSATVMGAKLPCLWEKSQKRDFFDVSEDVIMSFCVAGVALCDIPSCFKSRQKSFCVASAILLLHFQKMCCISRGRRSTLDTSDVLLRGRRSTFDVSCCVFSANRIVSAAQSGDKVQIPRQAWHFVTCHENRWKPRTKGRFCSRSIRTLVGKR